MLPLMSMMNSEELEKFFSDVKNWNETTLPRLEALSDAWEEADFKDLQTGVELCAGLQVARNFVANADKFRVEMRLRKVSAYMRKIESMEQKRGHVDVINKRTGILVKGVNHVAYVPTDQPLDENNVPIPLPPNAEQQAVEEKVYPVQKRIEDVATQGGGKFAIPRPKHYDEWLDKMSPELRADVEELNTYYTELAAADEILRSLYKNPMASHQDLSTAAKRVHAWDKKILAIFYRADVEWAELTGQTSQLEDPDKKYFEKAEKDANKYLGFTPAVSRKSTNPVANTTDTESAKNVANDASVNDAQNAVSTCNDKAKTETESIKNDTNSTENERTKTTTTKRRSRTKKAIK